jgi:hypothetical protein
MRKRLQLFDVKKAEIEIAKGLTSALEYAIKTIEGYELEIRNAKETIGIDLMGHGFCQGEVYKKAIDNIGDILEGTNEIADDLQ